MTPDAASRVPPALRLHSEPPPGPGRAACWRRRRAGAGARHGWPRLRAAAASAVGAREPGPPQRRCRRAPCPRRPRRAAGRAFPARKVLPVAAADGFAHRSVPSPGGCGAQAPPQLATMASARSAGPSAPRSSSRSFGFISLRSAWRAVHPASPQACAVSSSLPRLPWVSQGSPRAGSKHKPSTPSHPPPPLPAEVNSCGSLFSAFCIHLVKTFCV